MEYVEQSMKGWSSGEQPSDGGESFMMNVLEEELYNMPTSEFVHRRGFVARQLTVFHVALHACADLKSKEVLKCSVIIKKVTHVLTHAQLMFLYLNNVLELVQVIT